MSSSESSSSTVAVTNRIAMKLAEAVKADSTLEGSLRRDILIETIERTFESGKQHSIIVCPRPYGLREKSVISAMNVLLAHPKPNPEHDVVIITKGKRLRDELRKELQLYREIATNCDDAAGVVHVFNDYEVDQNTSIHNRIYDPNCILVIALDVDGSEAPSKTIEKYVREVKSDEKYVPPIISLTYDDTVDLKRHTLRQLDSTQFYPSTGEQDGGLHQPDMAKPERAAKLALRRAIGYDYWLTRFFDHDEKYNALNLRDDDIRDGTNKFSGAFAVEFSAISDTLAIMRYVCIEYNLPVVLELTHTVTADPPSSKWERPEELKGEMASITFEKGQGTVSKRPVRYFTFAYPVTLD